MVKKSLSAKYEEHIKEVNIKNKDDKKLQKTIQMFIDSYKYETDKILKTNVDKPGVLDVINKII